MNTQYLYQYPILGAKLLYEPVYPIIHYLIYSFNKSLTYWRTHLLTHLITDDPFYVGLNLIIYFVQQFFI